MKNLTKHIFAAFLIIALAALTLTVPVCAAETPITGSDSGTSGIAWTLDNGVLTVTPTDDNTTGEAYFGGTNFKTFFASNKTAITKFVIANSASKEFTTLNVSTSGLMGMSNVVTFTIPDSMTAIKNMRNGIQGATSMTTFGPEGTDPGCCDLSNFTSIATDYYTYYTFLGAAFTSVKIPTASTVKALPNYMFQECHNLKEVTIPSNIVTMTPIFAGCKGLKKVVIEGTNVNMQYTGKAFADATVYVYDGSSSLTWLQNEANVNMSGNPHAYVVMPLPPNTGSDTGTEGIEWALVGGVVTVTPSSDNTTGTAYFGATNWNTFVSNNKSKITEINIKNGDSVEFNKIYCKNAALIGITNLTKITFPSSVNNIDASARYAFADNKNLKTFGPAGTKDGCCDLSTITNMSDTYGRRLMFQSAAFTSVILPYASSVSTLPGQIFHNCDSLTEVTIPENITVILSYLTECDNLTKVVFPYKGAVNTQWATSAGGFSNATLYVHENSPIHAWAKTALNKNEVPYTIELLSREIIEGSDTGSKGIKWVLESGVLTVTPTDDNTTGEAYFGAANWTAFRATYKDSVNEIIIKNSASVEITKMYMYQIALCEFKNVTKITIPDTVTELAASARYGLANNSSLRTFGPEGTEDGLCDLSKITKLDNVYANWKMFEGAAFRKINFPTASTVTSLPSDIVRNCDYLTEFVIPKNINVMTPIAMECDNLKKVVILNDGTLNMTYAGTGFSDATVYVYEGSDALTWVQSATNMSEELYDYVVMKRVQKALSFDGFSIRYHSYNGLRSIFTMNTAKVNEGYELLEFGTFLISERYVDLGESTELKYENGEVVPVSDKTGTKLAIWENGERTDAKILGEKGGLVNYAVTLIKYPAEHITNNVYICGYEVWEDEYGNVSILYTETADTDKTNLCNITLLALKMSATDSRFDVCRTDIAVNTLAAVTGDKLLASGKVNSTVNYKVIPNGDGAAIVYTGAGAVDAVSIDSSVAGKVTMVVAGSGIASVSDEVAATFANASWVCVNDDMTGVPDAAEPAVFKLNGIDLSGASIVNEAGIDRYYYDDFNNKMSNVFGYTLPISTSGAGKSITFKIDGALEAGENRNYTDGNVIYVTASDEATLISVAISLVEFVPDKATPGSEVSATLPESRILPASILTDIANGVSDGIKLSLTTKKSPVEYTVGETIEFDIELLLNGELRSCPYFKYVITREGDFGEVITGYLPGATGKTTVKTSMDMAGFLTVKVWACGNDKSELLAAGNVYAGAGADIADIQVAAEEPDDFDEFWEGQLARLYEVDPEAIEITLTNSDNTYNTYAVKVDCIGDTSYTGYTFAALEVNVPKNATEKSLGIFVQFMPAGAVRDVTGSAARSTEMISVFVNSHSVPQGMEASYYTNLFGGALKNWWEPKTENADPAEVYYSYMILRDLQALRWLKSYYGEGGEGGNLWDGETIKIQGVSEGGFQAVAVAALDKDITNVFVSYPAMADKQGITIGRFKGHGSSDSSMYYYDTCYFARRITCDAGMIMGLIDTTCAPSANTAMYNNLINAKSKYMTYYQFLPHTYPNTSEYVPYRYDGELPKQVS